MFPDQQRAADALRSIRGTSPKALVSRTRCSVLHGAPQSRDQHLGGRRRELLRLTHRGEFRLGLMAPRKTRRPPISGSTASTSNPVEVEPVASLTQPIRYGPPNPARLPTELISVIAPAAAGREITASSLRRPHAVLMVPRLRKICTRIRKF